MHYYYFLAFKITFILTYITQVVESKPKGWKNAYAFKLNAKIEQKRSYHINDESQTEITKDDIISGILEIYFFR